MSHSLPDCLLVWLTPFLSRHDVLINGEEICEQSWADLKWDGMNLEAVRKARRRK